MGRYAHLLLEAIENETDIDHLRALARCLVTPSVSLIASKETYEKIKDVPYIEVSPFEGELEKVRAAARMDGVMQLEDHLKSHGRIPSIFTEETLYIDFGGIFEDYAHIPTGDEATDYANDIGIRARAYNKIVEPFPRIRTIVGPDVYAIIKDVDDIHELDRDRFVKIDGPPGTIFAIFEVFYLQNKLVKEARKRSV